MFHQSDASSCEGEETFYLQRRKEDNLSDVTQFLEIYVFYVNIFPYVYIYILFSSANLLDIWKSNSTAIVCFYLQQDTKTWAKQTCCWSVVLSILNICIIIFSLNKLREISPLRVILRFDDTDPSVEARVTGINFLSLKQHF